MKKQRIVIETSDQRKLALSRVLQQHGKTMKEWFEDQLELFVEPDEFTDVLQVTEITSPDELPDVQQVISVLSRIDWSFTQVDTQYLSHDIHPYPAKFIPQIPAHLIARLSLPGECVLDPFGGSGTTAVEALRLCRRAISLDANPLASLIGKVKTTPINLTTCADLKRLQVAVQTFMAGFAHKGIEFSDELATRYKALIPEIPNIKRWFSPFAIGELALLRHLITEVKDATGRDVASLVLSKVALKVSNQDAETRYAAKPKNIPPGFTLRCFIDDLHNILQKVERTARVMRFGEARFYTIDTREVTTDILPENSVDLIVTSPPYPNANDYHLYHRFRLYWLGYNPKSLAQVEIGSHLKHQRENSGFEYYIADLRRCLPPLYRALCPGRYAAFVVGDGLYKGELFHTAKSLMHVAKICGFEVCGEIERPIHHTKRSFIKPARRARAETIVILRKPPTPVSVTIFPPNYRMWPYEVILRRQETEALLRERINVADWDRPVTLNIPAYTVPHLRQLTFSHRVNGSKTWQSLLENGENMVGKRKEPKYTTHGIHAYKGKFYPQLAKVVMNIAGIEGGATVFDPFCGSGTVILEAFLNGLVGVGCDMHPLAAKIAGAKVGILTVDPTQCEEALSTFLEWLAQPPAQFPRSTEHFKKEALEEIFRWFPEPVIYKLNWILSQIEVIGTPAIRAFLEVVLSSIIRDISQQEPRDLRIRRRAVPLTDAPVIELFTQRLSEQFERLRAFWRVSRHQPVRSFAPRIEVGDCREMETLTRLRLGKATVDLILTSPPYATALPYIDTDRLSLLLLFGMCSQERALLEERLTGSREISKCEKGILESLMSGDTGNTGLPMNVLHLIKDIYQRNQQITVGFRRRNLPALLLRYFRDMQMAFRNMALVLKPGASAFVVVGDSKTTAGGEIVPIPTTALLAEIASSCGLNCVEKIPISVTTENLKHIRNAIVENTILRFVREP